MLDFSPEKMIMIFFIVMLVLGPEKLPEVARKIGKLSAELRKLSGGFQDEIRQAVRDTTTDTGTGDGSSPSSTPTPPAADAGEVAQSASTETEGSSSGP